MTEPSAQLSPEDLLRFGADPLATLGANLASVEARIASACARSGRDRASVHLLPITKTVPAHILRLAYGVGLRCFGENKVQEAMKKCEALTDLAIDWSIVGHLQSNKAKHVARFAHAFHALDSLPLARLLNARAVREGRDLDVYIQINTSGQVSKFGLSPEALLPFVASLADFPHLRPRGLMTIALMSAESEEVRPCFAMLRRLRDETAARAPAIRELSMGMSGDFETAIEEGATIVRVGQAIFGRRSLPDSHYWPG